jgi:hypothetical protein
MKTRNVEGNGDFRSMPNEADLNLREQVNIDHHPHESRCDCCGRPERELPPFYEICNCCGRPIGVERGFLTDEYPGRFLQRVHGGGCPQNENLEKLWSKYFGDCWDEQHERRAVEIFVRKFGKKRLDHLMMYRQLRDEPFPAWLCRACISLGSEEYWERYGQSRVSRTS